MHSPMANIFLPGGMDALLREDQSAEWKRQHPLTLHARALEGKRRGLIHHEQARSPRNGNGAAVAVPKRNPYLQPNELAHLTSAMKPAGSSPRVMSSWEQFTPTMLTQANLEAPIHADVQLAASYSTRDLSSHASIVPHHLAPTTASLQSAKNIDAGNKHLQSPRKKHFYVDAEILPLNVEATEQQQRGLAQQNPHLSSTTSLASIGSTSSTIAGSPRYRVHKYNGEDAHLTASAQRLEKMQQRAHQRAKDSQWEQKVVEHLLTERERKARREHLRRIEEQSRRDQAKKQKLAQTDAARVKERQQAQIMQQQLKQQQLEFAHQERVYEAALQRANATAATTPRRPAQIYPHQQLQQLQQILLLSPLSPASYTISPRSNSQRSFGSMMANGAPSPMHSSFGSPHSPSHLSPYPAVSPSRGHVHHPPSFPLPVAVEDGHTTLLEHENEEQPQETSSQLTSKIPSNKPSPPPHHTAHTQPLHPTTSHLLSTSNSTSSTHTHDHSNDSDHVHSHAIHRHPSLPHPPRQAHTHPVAKQHSPSGSPQHSPSGSPSSVHSALEEAAAGLLHDGSGTEPAEKSGRHSLNGGSPHQSPTVAVVDPHTLLRDSQADQTNAILEVTQPWLSYDPTHSQDVVHHEAEELLSHMVIPRVHIHSSTGDHHTKHRQQHQRSQSNFVGSSAAPPNPLTHLSTLSSHARASPSNSPTLAPSTSPETMSPTLSKLTGLGLGVGVGGGGHGHVERGAHRRAGSSINKASSRALYQSSIGGGVNGTSGSGSPGGGVGIFQILRSDSFNNGGHGGSSSPALEHVHQTFATAHALLNSVLADAKGPRPKSSFKHFHGAPSEGRNGSPIGNHRPGDRLAPAKHARRPSSSLASSLVDDELVNMAHEDIQDRIEGNKIEVDKEYARKKALLIAKGPKRSDKQEDDMSHWVVLIHQQQLEERRLAEEEERARKEAERARMAAAPHKGPAPPPSLARMTTYTVEQSQSPQ